MTDKIKSPALEKHEYFMAILREATTLQELSAIRTEYTVDTVLSDQQKSVLKSIYEINEMRLKIVYPTRPGKAAPQFASPQDRVAATHAQDDAVAFATPQVADEVFPDIEVNTTNTTIINETTTIPSAPISDSVPESSSGSDLTSPKDSDTDSGSGRKDQSTGTPAPAKGSKRARAGVEQSVTLTREIKLPIDGVQFSNDLFSVTLTAPTYEEAKTAIEEAFTDFTTSTKLISKDHVDKAYAQGLADGKKATTPVVPTTPAKKAEYKTNEERARQMLIQMTESMPMALEFAKQFTALNPMVATTIV